MPVTHCLCEKKSFAEILDWARQNDALSVDECARALGCSTHCGMCGPYLAWALATGRAVVPYPCPPMPAEAKR